MIHWVPISQFYIYIFAVNTIVTIFLVRILFWLFFSHFDSSTDFCALFFTLACFTDPSLNLEFVYGLFFYHPQSLPPTQCLSSSSRDNHRCQQQLLDYFTYSVVVLCPLLFIHYLPFSDWCIYEANTAFAMAKALLYDACTWYLRLGLVYHIVKPYTKYLWPTTRIFLYHPVEVMKIQSKKQTFKDANVNIKLYFEIYIFSVKLCCYVWWNSLFYFHQWFAHLCHNDLSQRMHLPHWPLKFILWRTLDFCPFFLSFASISDARPQWWGNWGRSRRPCFGSPPSFSSQPIRPCFGCHFVPRWVHHSLFLFYVSMVVRPHFLCCSHLCGCNVSFHPCQLLHGNLYGPWHFSQSGGRWG